MFVKWHPSFSVICFVHDLELCKTISSTGITEPMQYFMSRYASFLEMSWFWSWQLLSWSWGGLVYWPCSWCWRLLPGSCLGLKWHCIVNITSCYTLWVKRSDTFYHPLEKHLLIFNIFICEFPKKFCMQPFHGLPPHLKYVVTLLCKLEHSFKSY